MLTNGRRTRPYKFFRNKKDRRTSSQTDGKYLHLFFDENCLVIFRNKRMCFRLIEQNYVQMDSKSIVCVCSSSVISSVFKKESVEMELF